MSVLSVDDTVCLPINMFKLRAQEFSLIQPMYSNLFRHLFKDTGMAERDIVRCRFSCQGN